MNAEMNPDEQPTEHRIETVLAALREAKPAAGMEQRISAALLQQDDAASSARPRWTWLSMPQIAGAAAVVAAALLLSAHFYRNHTAGPIKDHASLRLPIEALPEKAAGLSPLNHAPASEGLQPRPASSGAEAPLQAQRVSGLKAAAFSGNATNAGRGRWAKESTQPAAQPQLEQGFPAPPLPLTEQERLLIRLVHRGDPVQLAQLAPAAREIQLQRDREQVREFFKPPPMLAANFKLEPYPVIGGSE